MDWRQEVRSRAAVPRTSVHSPQPGGGARVSHVQGRNTPKPTTKRRTALPLPPTQRAVAAPPTLAKVIVDLSDRSRPPKRLPTGEID